VNVYKRAKELRDTTKLTWKQITDQVNEEFKSTLSFETLRKKVYDLNNLESIESQPDFHQNLLKELQVNKSYKQLSDKYNLSERKIKEGVDALKKKGYNIQDDNGEVHIRRVIVPEENIHEVKWKGNKIIRFAVCGDNQENSKYTQITHLHTFYDIVKSEGIDTVYHTGDIDEGEQMRPGHQYECYSQGADEHVHNICRNYPRREGIHTHFITGNHDHSIIKRCGYDIGHSINENRNDMHYLGMSDTIINLTPNCKLELRHPLDGTAYAISYKMQKMIDAMQGGEKPNILCVGHYHKAEYLFYRNIHTFQTGAFQAQTPWMKGKQISANVGGWIIELHVEDDGTIRRCKGEFIPFYNMIKDDWRNWLRQ